MDRQGLQFSVNSLYIWYHCLRCHTGSAIRENQFLKLITVSSITEQKKTKKQNKLRKKTWWRHWNYKYTLLLHWNVTDWFYIFWDLNYSFHFPASTMVYVYSAVITTHHWQGVTFPWLPSKKRRAGRHVAMTPESSRSKSKSGEKDGDYWSTGLNKGSVWTCGSQIEDRRLNPDEHVAAH